MSNWQEITVETTEEAAEAVANLFYDVGAQGVVIEDPRVIARYVEEDLWDAYELPAELLEAENVIIKGYLPMDERLEERLDLFEKLLADLEQFFVSWLAKVSYAEIAEADWSSAWKEYYKPQQIGEKIVISPSWEDYRPQGGEIVVWLDPGMAFGTGSHPTTAMVIQALEKYLKPGSQVIDVGTGSGILAIVAAKLGAASVLALDIDTLAVEIAQQNVELNRVSDRVTVRYNDLLTGVEGQYQMIIANLTADPVLALARDAYDRLSPAGVLLASGIIRHRLPEVEAKLLNLGYHLVETEMEGEWVSLVARKD
ncbi:MAG: 50S ribosomal protein L11 methyltransferase [Clostridia bacterium]|nr:50S ribosomal protein L11 methyltransferase [Clostridia bacterium]